MHKAMERADLQKCFFIKTSWRRKSVVDDGDCTLKRVHRRKWRLGFSQPRQDALHREGVQAGAMLKYDYRA
jgi:hypothetical protein